MSRTPTIGPNKVRVSMKTDAGETVSFSLKTAMLINLVNLSVGAINSSMSQVFRDLDVF